MMPQRVQTMRGPNVGPRSPARPRAPHALVAQRTQPFGGSANWSIFVAMMKSFSCNPLIFLVRKDTVA